MTVNVSNTAVTNTPTYLIDRTNELADAMSTKAVTVGSNTAIGDAAINGTFTAENYVANATTTSTTNATGALVVKGGAGIAENLNVGGTFDLDGIGTFNANASFTGIVTHYANVSLGDSDVLAFGDADDLKIYHDSTDSIINGTSLKIDSDVVTVRNGSSTETLATFTANGAVDLYYDNASKITTTATGADVTGTITVDGIVVDGTTDVNGVATFRTPADIAFDNMSSNGGKYVRVNAGGTAVEYANAEIDSVFDLGNVELNGSLANSHVLAYDITAGKFKNYPRSLLDAIQFSDLDNLDGSGAGSILVKTTGASGLTGTSNGYVAGRMDNVSETTFTSQTGNTITYSSDANSHLQVFKNGVKLVPTTDFTHDTNSVDLIVNLDAADIVQVVEFDPTAIVAADGTATDTAHADYSDMRLKEDIQFYTPSEDVYNLNTYTYYWQDKDRFHDRQEVGFIAQELEQFVPQTVIKNSDGERMVDYGKMSAVLMSLIKEQKERIDGLEELLKLNGIGVD